MFIGEIEATKAYLPQILMFAGVMVVMFVLFHNARRRYRERQSGQSLSAEDRLMRMKRESVMKNDLRTMMVELEDLTRRFSAQLDAKSMQLDNTIREADAKIAELRSLTDGGSDIAARAGGGGGEGGGPVPARVETPGGSGGSGGSGGPEFAAGPGASLEAAAKEALGAGEEDDPLKRRIYALDDEGQTSVQIATELGEHMGKVELILALRRQAAS